MEEGQREVSRRQQSIGVLIDTLNAVNLARGNGEARLREEYPQLRAWKVVGEKGLRGLLREELKILKLFRDSPYCPEEDLNIFRLLSEGALACFQL